MFRPVPGHPHVYNWPLKHIVQELYFKNLLAVHFEIFLFTFFLPRYVLKTNIEPEADLR
jgi:hypothetical protein